MTQKVFDKIKKYLPYYDAVLLESHGALTWSTDLLAAYHKMESVEFYAELLYKSKMLGGPKEFDQKTIEKLYEIRRKMGLSGKHPADFCQNKGSNNCHNCGACGKSEATTGSVSSVHAAPSPELVAEITKKVIAQLGL